MISSVEKKKDIRAPGIWDENREAIPEMVIIR